jgi:hypothetical protein
VLVVVLMVFGFGVMAVVHADTALPTLMVNMTLAPGEQFAMDYTAPPGAAATAWFGIVPSTVPHGDEAENAKNALLRQPLNGKTSGILLLTAPVAPGTYDLRLFADNVGGKELSSATFLVARRETAAGSGAARTFRLTAPTDSGVLTSAYPRTNLRLRCTVAFTRPGTIFDTIGITGAPVGAFAVTVSDDGRVALHVYDPERQSPVKVANGWHILRSGNGLTKSEPGEVIIDIRPTEMTVQVKDGPVARMTLPTPLSGKPIYVGNFPGDDDWGPGNNIHAGMIGTVIVTECGGLQGVTAAPLVSGASFAGAWDTDFNDLTFTITGNQVTGTYAYKGGQITGTLSADRRTITGQWTQLPSRKPPFDTGRCTFTLAPDGQAFVGKWGYGEDAPASKWEGTRKGTAATTPNPPQPAGPPALFAGKWDSTFGVVELKVDGVRVTGTYPTDQGRIEGTLSADGRTLTGRWSEAPDYLPPNNAGRMVLTLAPDGQSFTGNWSYGDAEPDRTWTGKRMP